MRKIVRWIVPALVCMVVAAVALIIRGAVQGGAKHDAVHSTSSPAAAAPARTGETTTAAPPTPKRRRTVTPGVPKSGRCADVAVNRHTSCAFARVVVEAYDANPSSSFLARSPVTGLTYTMHCREAHGVVACDDNSTSTLEFNGPPPAPR